MAKGKSKTTKRSVPSAVKSLMDQHPMVKRMRSDMAKAIAGVAKGAARGPAARGRQRSVFQ